MTSSYGFEMIQGLTGSNELKESHAIYLFCLEIMTMYLMHLLRVVVGMFLLARGSRPSGAGEGHSEVGAQLINE